MKCFSVTWDMETRTCVNVLVVPKEAIEEPGKIYSPQTSMGSQEKHALYALVQTLYYQYQDNEISPDIVCSSCEIVAHDYNKIIEDGMILFRADDGKMGLLAFETSKVSKLLETANRFCTRWIRLDI